MVEHAREERLLVLESLEVLRLARRLNVPGAGVAAVDPLLSQDRLEPRHRLGPDLVQLPRFRFAEAMNERFWIQLEAGQHLTTVARAGARAHPVALEHEDRRACPRKMPGRRQAGRLMTDDWRMEPPEGYPTSTGSFSRTVIAAHRHVF